MDMRSYTDVEGQTPVCGAAQLHKEMNANYYNG